MTLTRTCPDCDKRMVRRFDLNTTTTYPPPVRWRWWCACGALAEPEPGDSATYDEAVRAEWQRVNRSK